MEIIRQENIEKDYKIMAEPDLQKLLHQIISGNLVGLNSWLEIQDEYTRLVITDFKKLQEKYDSLLSDARD